MEKVINQTVTEARGKGKGQKLDRLFKLVGDLQKDNLSKEEIEKLNKAKETAKAFEPESDYEKKDKQNLIDQIEKTLSRVNESVEESQSVEMSTPEFELMLNNRDKILAFFKGDEESFKDAIETGKDLYGEESGYKESDKYVVIDKEHPFGMALYSTSDDEIVDTLKWQAEEEEEIRMKRTRSVTEEKEDREEILTLEDVLKAHLEFHVNEDHSVTVKLLGQEDGPEVVIPAMSDEEFEVLKAEFHDDEESHDEAEVKNDAEVNSENEVPVDAHILSKKEVEKEIEKNQDLEESVMSDTDIFDVLGIEEENREKSGHLIAQYKELEKKYPQASIWLKGDVGVYVDGKVVGETADLSAVDESKVEEGGSGSGNFKSGAQRHNDKMQKIWDTYDKRQQKFADFLLSKGISKEDVEKLKQDSGLHGNPLQQKFVELGGKLEGLRVKEDVETDKEPQLPTEVAIDVELLVDDGIDPESAYLDDVISDWLSDNYGFCHYGFNYEVVGDKVYVTDIAWDTSESLKENTLTEGTSNFGTNDIINLCSPYQDPDDFDDFRKEEIENNPDITEDELRDAVYDLIGAYYDDMYEQTVDTLKNVDDYVTVEGGYYEGFYIDFEFNNGEELAEHFFNDEKDYAIYSLKRVVENIRVGLKKAIEEGWLVGYDVAYRFSNGETGYNLSNSHEKDLKAVDEAMNIVLEEGLEAIEEEYIDEIED